MARKTGYFGWVVWGIGTVETSRKREFVLFGFGLIGTVLGKRVFFCSEVDGFVHHIAYPRSYMAFLGLICFLCVEIQLLIYLLFFVSLVPVLKW